MITLVAVFRKRGREGGLLDEKMGSLGSALLLV